MSPSPVEVDVAIVGGGPAGAAAALTLLRYTRRRVAVIERSRFDAPRIGESTSSSILELLRFIGAGHVVSAQTARASTAAVAAWGGAGLMVRHALFTSQGDGLLLDRRAFDAALCDEVAARGGELLRGHAVQRIARAGEQWQLAMIADGAPVTVRCRFVIDASGRRAGVARQLGVRSQRDDAMVGVVWRFPRRADGDGDGGHDPAEPDATLVEAAPDGWWYTAPVPDGALIAMWMTDAPLLRTWPWAEPAGLAQALDAAPHTRARIAGRAAPSPPRIVSAGSHRLAAMAGPGWAAAGDAAAAFDPLSAMGIGHALWSGTHAARVAEDVLLAPASRAGAAYDAALQQQYAQYLQRRALYYRLEQRWPERGFWRARHGARIAAAA